MLNKFIQKDVYDISIYDKENNQIAYIDSVYSNEIIVKKGRIFFYLTDALIDKNFLEYILTNRNFEGKIKANTRYREIQTNDDFSVYLNMLNVKLLRYKLRNTCKEISHVDMLFELFKNEKYINNFWNDELDAEKELEVYLLNFKNQIKINIC